MGGTIRDCGRLWGTMRDYGDYRDDDHAMGTMETTPTRTMDCVDSICMDLYGLSNADELLRRGNEVISSFFHSHHPELLNGCKFL